MGPLLLVNGVVQKCFSAEKRTPAWSFCIICTSPIILLVCPLLPLLSSPQQNCVSNREALERLRFTFKANGKRQTQVENFSE